MEIIKASLDRFEGEFAVIYSDDNRRFDVPQSLVKGIGEGARLLLYVNNDQVQEIQVDKQATKEAKERIKDKYRRLRQGKHLNG